MDPVDDAIEFVNQASTWFTAFTALTVRGESPSFAAQWVMCLLLILVNIVTILMQVFGLCVGTPYLLMWFNNYFGVFTFSNTDRDLDDGPLASIVPW